MNYPPTIYRVKSGFIDVILLLIVFSLAAYLIDLNQGAPSWVRMIVFIGMLYAYEPLMVGLTGGTIGHHLLKIRVVKLNDPNSKIGMLTATLRVILKIVLGWLSVFISYTREDRRTLHDLMCGTNVLFKANNTGDSN